MWLLQRFGDKVGAEVYLDGDRATVEDVFTLSRDEPTSTDHGRTRQRWNAVLLRVGPDTFLADRHPDRYRVYKRSKTNQAFVGRPSEKRLKLKSDIHGRLRPSDYQRGSTEHGHGALLLNNNVYVKPEPVGCYGPDLTWFMRIDTPARDLAQFDTSRESEVTRPLNIAVVVGILVWALAHFFHDPAEFLVGFTTLGTLGAVFGRMEFRIRDSPRILSTAFGGWLCLCALPAIPLHFGWARLEPSAVAEWWALAMLLSSVIVFAANRPLFSVLHRSLRIMTGVGLVFVLIAAIVAFIWADYVGEAHPQVSAGTVVVAGLAWLAMLASHVAGPLRSIASTPTAYPAFRAQIDRLADRLEAGYSEDVRAEVVEAFDLLRWALSSSSDERVVACMAYYRYLTYLADRLFDQQRDGSFVKVGFPVTDHCLEEVTQEDWRQLGEDLRNMAPGGKSVRISPTLCSVLARPDHAHHP